MKDKHLLAPQLEIATERTDLGGLECGAGVSPDKLKLDRRTSAFISKLLKIHVTAKLHVTRASDDVEISIPDPELLKIDGPKELYSKHLYVNATKMSRQHNPHLGAARCVKTGKFYFKDQLLSYPPIKDRKDLGWDPEKYLKNFKPGIFIPENIDLDRIKSVLAESGINNTSVCPVGDCVNLTELKPDHPAVLYLTERGYGLKALEEQFNAKFCIKEHPRLKYLLGRVKTETDDDQDFNPATCLSPQGRIVFYGMQFGVEKIWQCRVVEKTDDKLGVKYYYAYYGKDDDPRNGWYPVAALDKKTRKYVALNGLSNSVIKRKYILPPGAQSANHLMGFDAALKWNKDHKIFGDKIIGVCEGVFDAARLGPPFCAVMGASISLYQCALIANNFKHVFYASDHDEAGGSLKSSLENRIYSARNYYTSATISDSMDYKSALNLDGITSFCDVVLHEFKYPSNFKDLGEIKDPVLVEELKSQILKI